MKKAYDVIIIGGGIIGCATAFELAKRGITDILLIEKRFLTSGATGRCGAGIRQQWGSELNARIALESTHIFEHLEEYTGYTRSCGLHQGGYLLVAYTEKEWAQFQENLKVQHKLGIDSRAVDLKEAKEIVPYLNTDGMFGATFCQKDGHADPFQCTQAYAQGAKRMGVEFLTYTEVTGLQTKAGRIHAVETTNGTFEARTVINCANVHAPELAKMVGEDIPVTSERHGNRAGCTSHRLHGYVLPPFLLCPADTAWKLRHGHRPPRSPQLQFQFFLAVSGKELCCHV